MLREYTGGGPFPVCSWFAMEAHWRAMRLNTEVIQSVVFIGWANNGPFVPYGTGFVTVSRYDGQAFQTLVTAKHVIEDIPGDIVFIRVNQRGGGAKLVAAKKESWYPHPSAAVDLMVCPAVFPMDQFQLMHIDFNTHLPLTQASIQSEAIGVGDDVAIVGMFVSRLGETRNIPVVRSGTIAAMPVEPIETKYGAHDAYLVETRSIDGLSGSPVFVQLPRERPVDGATIQKSHRVLYWMGMLLGHHEVINPRDAVEIKQRSASPPYSENAVTARVMLNTGIGIVLPASLVRQAVEQPAILTLRREIVEKLKTQRRFVADSAVAQAGEVAPAAEPVPTPTEGDEQHAERFSSLLDAAVGKSKQGD